MLLRFVDAAAVEAEIACVRSLSGGALRRRWQAVFGRPPPWLPSGCFVRGSVAVRMLWISLTRAKPASGAAPKRPCQRRFARDSSLIP